MFSESIIGMFVYKEVTSNDAIISSSSMGTFMMCLENVVASLILLLSSLTQALRMLAMYLFRLCSREPLYETGGFIQMAVKQVTWYKPLHETSGSLLYNLNK